VYRYVEVHAGTTHPTDNPLARQFMQAMYDEGLQIFHKEPNVQYSGGDGLCVEYAFTRTTAQALAQPAPTAAPVCRWVLFRKAFNMCVHPSPDAVSDTIARSGHWGDCASLPGLWKSAVHAPIGKTTFLDVGANIGACSMEMLLHTDANVIAIEPNPDNFFRLSATVDALPPSLKSRITIHNFAVGSSEGTAVMFAAHGNQGNSVLGKQIGDFPGQKFGDATDISVKVLDNALQDNISSVKVIKIDVQGNECTALPGMVEILRAAEVVKFEVANNWLTNQGCSDVELLNIFRQNAFEVFDHDGTILRSPKKQEVYDLVARKVQNA
jgi:FkbM family methyltransferase